ncbi:MAG: DUF1599 domain-containing protein [Lacibacter sp.]
MDTVAQYNHVIASCKAIFLAKAKDYGTSWRVYRMIAVVDQIYIKAKRIRTIQEKQQQRIGDSIASEFRGILNYAVIGLLQLQLPEADDTEMDLAELERLYDREIEKARNLMLDKNHDYGEAWRDMQQETFTDMILARLHRIRQILQNNGTTLVSEGVDANLYDIINYSAFALILIETGQHKG